MTLNVQSLSDRVYEILRWRIVVHDIAPGEPIRQDALASEFEISKVPLREALTRLDEGNFVHLITHKGFVASPLSLAEVDEIFSLRLMLEPLIAAKSALTADAAEQKAVEIALNRLKDDPGDISTGALARRSLISALFSQPGQATTVKLVLQLFDRAERYYCDRSLPQGQNLARVRALVSAWLRRDADGVLEDYTQWLQFRADAARRSMYLGAKAS